MKIAIIGLGYVGLPLCLQFARNDVEVLGLDIDPAKVDSINRCESYIQHIRRDDVQELVSAKKLSASNDFAEVRNMELDVREPVRDVLLQ